MTSCVFTVGPCRDTWHGLPSGHDRLRAHAAALARRYGQPGELWAARYYADYYRDDVPILIIEGVGKRVESGQ